MLSDRGRLSGTATEFVQTFAPRLAHHFAPLVQLYLDPLIKLLGRPNKVVLKRTEKCLSIIISKCHIPSILLELKRGLYDEAATCRRGCSIAIERALHDWPEDGATWNEKSLEALEQGIKKMATDKDPEVRQTGRRVWARFQDLFPERVEDFSAPLTPTVRRYLEIAPTKVQKAVKSRPKPPAKIPLPPSRPLSAASSSSSTSANVHAAPPIRPTGKSAASKPLPTLHKSKSQIMRPLPVVPVAPSRVPSKPVAFDSPPKRSSPVKRHDRREGHHDSGPRIPSASTRVPQTTSVRTSPSKQSPVKAWQPFLLSAGASSKASHAYRDEPTGSMSDRVREMFPRSVSTMEVPLRSTVTRHAKNSSQSSLRDHDIGLAMPRSNVDGMPGHGQQGLSKSVSTMAFSHRVPVASPLESTPYAHEPSGQTSLARPAVDEPYALEPPAETTSENSTGGPSAMVGEEPAVELGVTQQLSSGLTSSVSLPSPLRALAEPSVTPGPSSALPPRESTSLGSGSGSSIKNKIAMFEQRSREATSGSASPTPTIARIVSSSKGQGSPLAHLFQESPLPVGSVSPLVKLDDGDNMGATPRVRAGMDSMGETTFRVGHGVSNGYLEELAGVFDAPVAESQVVEPLIDTTEMLEGAELVTEALETQAVSPGKNEMAEELDQQHDPDGPAKDSEIGEGAEEQIEERQNHPVVTDDVAHALVDTKDTLENVIQPTAPSTTLLTADLPKAAGLPAHSRTVSANLNRETRGAAPRPPLGRAERKPFKPTSHAQPTAASLARTTSNPLKISRDVSSTSRPPVPKLPPAVRLPSKAVPESRKASTKPVASSDPIPTVAPPAAPRPPTMPSSASVRSFSASTVASGLKQTLGSASQSGSTLDTRSEMGRAKQSMPPRVISNTLPPIRKEKIKRKAPLPSFVPTRNRAQAGATSAPAPAPAPPLPRSVSSQSGATARVRSVVAKVRPEAIPLPASPHHQGCSTLQAPSPSSPHLIPLQKSPTVPHLTPLRKALSGTPIKAKVSPALMAESAVVASMHAAPASSLSPIDAWRRAIPPSPVDKIEQWRENVPPSPLAVRRGSANLSPLSIQHPHLATQGLVEVESPTSSRLGEREVRSLGVSSPVRKMSTRSWTSPSPLAIHAMSSEMPVSPSPRYQGEVDNDDDDDDDGDEVGSPTRSHGHMPRQSPVMSKGASDTVPSPFLKSGGASESRPSRSRLSLEATTPLRLRVPPTSPSPLATATLARVSAEQLVALSPTGSRSSLPSLFQAQVPSPANAERDAFPSNSTRYTKASGTSTQPPLSEDLDDEALDEGQEALQGIRFNNKSSSTQPILRPRPKVKNQLVVDGGDLIEFSRSTRSVRGVQASSGGEHLSPIHGQRTDVVVDRSPEKSVEILLAKIYDGSPVKMRTPSALAARRAALSVRDANASPEGEEQL
ncbi:clasp N terminal-domain-containing protein [Kockovaella imperatae]|uniref:Clasp N terminal-domain-containing protein n=1 Tax=Kockovaella imperatae TaxID=4999 RepID=A0A1Y1UKW3_9TREE|nr:clasp N terminal-domain-containing protein [Kockovaella imperatae]ORX38690.1 clasp N terminal-domain-containing protein [Kockovaella imperatae]